MDHIVNQIAALNTITETLVRITYLKTIYRCPTKAEMEYDEYDHDEENHHAYYTTKKVCILSVYGERNSNDDEWRACTIDSDIRIGKIHKRYLGNMKEIMNRQGFCQYHFNRALYEDDHYQIIITKIETMN